MAEKIIKEIVQFFKETGFQVTPKGDGWPVRHAHLSIPGKAIHEDQTTEQLRAFTNLLKVAMPTICSASRSARTSTPSTFI